jgi:uncharacterized protein YkwD
LAGGTYYPYGCFSFFLKKSMTYPGFSIVSGVAILLMVSCSLSPAEVPKPKAPEAYQLSSEEQEAFLNLVNDLRNTGCRCGDQYMPPVPALQLNESLVEIAEIHALDMQRNTHFDHRGTDGSRVGDRLTRQGYNWRAAGENIAVGYDDVDSVFAGWQRSAGHCENMMSRDFTQLGIARRGPYWVNTLARPRSGG